MIRGPDFLIIILISSHISKNNLLFLIQTFRLYLNKNNDISVSKSLGLRGLVYFFPNIFFLMQILSNFEQFCEN